MKFTAKLRLSKLSKDVYSQRLRINREEWICQGIGRNPQVLILRNLQRKMHRRVVCKLTDNVDQLKHLIENAKSRGAWDWWLVSAAGQSLADHQCFYPVRINLWSLVSPQFVLPFARRIPCLCWEIPCLCLATNTSVFGIESRLNTNKSESLNILLIRYKRQL